MEGLQKCGTDVYISQNAIIKRPNLCRIGNHVAIDDFVYCTTALILSDYIHISPMVSIIGGAYGMLRMGNFTNISAGGRIVVRSDEFLGEGLVGPVIPDEYRDNVLGNEIIIEDFANIGTNAVILAGVTMSEGSVLGACSLLTHDTEPWTIYVGVPARPLKIRKRHLMLEYAAKLGYYS